MRVLLVVATALLAAACGSTTAAGPVPAPPPSSSVVSEPVSEPPPAETSTETSIETTTPPPQPAPAPQPVAVAGTPCDITNGACVQLSTAQTWLISNGVVTYGPVPITSGRPGHETPTGTFGVLWKVRHEVSREFNNAPMPYSVYFAEGGIAFHEGSLVDLSHGCVHLSQEAAALYFETLTSGDAVQVVA